MLHYKSRFQIKSTKNLRDLKRKATDKSFSEERYKVSEGNTRQTFDNDRPVPKASHYFHIQYVQFKIFLFFFYKNMYIPAVAFYGETHNTLMNPVSRRDPKSIDLFILQRKPEFHGHDVSVLRLDNQTRPFKTWSSLLEELRRMWRQDMKKKKQKKTASSE